MTLRIHGRPKARSRLTAGAAAVLTMIATVVLSFGTPAGAYVPNPTVRFAVVDLDNCGRIEGNLAVTSHPNGCALSDSFDGTFFRRDPGGVAVKMQFHTSNGTMVGKMEFHPYGEHLWVYDTRNDSDTIYAAYNLYSSAGYEGSGGPLRGPVNGYNNVNLSIADGWQICIAAYDDVELTDWIDYASLCGVA
jgi:hypothetical protein